MTILWRLVLALLSTTSKVSPFAITTRTTRGELKYKNENASSKMNRQIANGNGSKGNPMKMSGDRNNNESFLKEFNPLHLNIEELWDAEQDSAKNMVNKGAVSMGIVAMGQALAANAAEETIEKAKAVISIDTSTFSSNLTPDNFKPVCPASDTLYRFLTSTTKVVVGDESFVRFGPLIAQGLLRVRLEICVVESFVNEAVVPFIEKNGIDWVLPLHETVETFLAGTIFGLASTFILVGSTKLITVIFTYSDFFIGAPCRFFGGIAYDRARGKPITWDIGLGTWKTRLIGPKDDTMDLSLQARQNSDLDFSNVNPVLLPLVLLTGTVKLVGYTSKTLRQVIEGFDLFVGRYLVLVTTGYIGIKFLHFKVFPDFPNFVLPELLPHLPTLPDLPTF